MQPLQFYRHNEFLVYSGGTNLSHHASPSDSPEKDIEMSLCMKVMVQNKHCEQLPAGIND
jgi:hypothetical protein